MPEFEFTLCIAQRLSGEREMDSIYGRCKDASLLVEGNATRIEFQRQAASLQDAIRSAITDVNAAGFHVAQVELLPDSVTVQTA